jgi:hypothetical protein
VLIPQDVDYPGLALNIDRQQASLEGLTPKTIVVTLGPIRKSRWR